jgi:hypothetical protein
MNGTNISNPTDRSAFSENPPDVFSARPASSGVRNIPRRLDAEALHSAAATFPPAIDVKATEACTVEGKVQRNRRPR